MGSVEQGLGRGLALAAGADWHAANLPAALQGGARRAIFRGLYKGAEEALRRPGSASARDWEGRGDTCTGSRYAEATGLRPHAGLRPSLGCQVEPQAAGACAPQRGEGRVSPFWRGRGRLGGESPECGVRMPPGGRARREDEEAGVGRRAGHFPLRLPSRPEGREPRGRGSANEFLTSSEINRGVGRRAEERKSHQKPLHEFPTGCQGAEKKRQRRKRHTMEQNKGECAKTAAGARLARLAQAPPPAPPAPQCVPPRPAPPHPARPAFRADAGDRAGVSLAVRVDWNWTFCWGVC